MTIGEDGATIAANTLIKDALQIINGVEPGEYDVDYGTVTTSSVSTLITIPHALKRKPTAVGISGTSTGVGRGDMMSSYSVSTFTTADKSNISIGVTSSPSYGDAYFNSGQTITWVAIAKK